MVTGVASPAPLSLSKIAVKTARHPKKETTEFSLRAPSPCRAAWENLSSHAFGQKPRFLSVPQVFPPVHLTCAAVHSMSGSHNIKSAIALKTKNMFICFFTNNSLRVKVPRLPHSLST